MEQESLRKFFCGFIAFFFICAMIFGQIWKKNYDERYNNQVSKIEKNM
ncbi:MAG: hypothetical protein UR79_C0001G0275 [Candidatus Campbellbacteria bacterium GW2011_GWD1_35_49]|nr:MAG: hypothetical protein UR74_C0001G0054 [Candidatus Campbellbacteria bacterium GW2011_GWD2_35_24]KKP76241.1 MAG: hypothetical protein UR75_C0001G0275 [Candidatus Campbellbacteria bacterium GW2011_GWC2_35_28]KKP77430.1 MAG: hypothetical protein UR76_C0001G0275 [Candidatus Campbellbacteria bacterium GW2011_GWC1_35_31]KKP79359.1 MAG: hypothetical protein UR79_C0001G0275 [Candidatus Campbellbacteria bacterium GW2011_GWD1_35_49]